MHLNQAFTNCQTEAKTSIAARGGTLRLPKFVEDKFLFFGRDSQTGVADLNGHPVVSGANAERDFALCCKLDRIINQVERHLSQPCAVTPDLRQISGDFISPNQALILGQLLANDAYWLPDLVQVKWLAGQLQLPGLIPR